MGYSRRETYSGVSKPNLSRSFCRLSDGSPVGISDGLQIDVTVAAQPFLFVRPVGYQLDEGRDVLFPDTAAAHFSAAHFYFNDMFGIEPRGLIHRFLEPLVILFGEHLDFRTVQHQRNPGAGIVGT